MKIAVIVGINADSYSDYDRSPWLEDMPDDLFKLSNAFSEPSSDICVGYYLQKHYPKYNVDILTYDDVSLEKFNEYDLIIGFYCPYYVYFSEGENEYKKYLRIINRTKATYLQDTKLTEFVLYKSKYHKFLHKEGFPTLPTEYLDLTKDKQYLKNFYKRIEKKEWEKFVSKPEFGGYGEGFKIWGENTYKEKSFFKYVDQMKKKGFKKMLFQKFVKDFHDFYEVRTYWHNGVYKYAVGTIIDLKTLGTGDETLISDVPESEGGEIEESLMRKLKKMGKEVIETIPFDTPFSFRIDFGCCLDNKKICREYFINEIEYNGNLLANDTEFEVIESLGKTIIKRANSLKKNK